MTQEWIDPAEQQAFIAASGEDTEMVECPLCSGLGCESCGYDGMVPEPEFNRLRRKALDNLSEQDAA